MVSGELSIGTLTERCDYTSAYLVVCTCATKCAVHKGEYI
jgi:hypothetical protein